MAIWFMRYFAEEICDGSSKWFPIINDDNLIGKTLEKTKKKTKLNKIVFN